MSDKQYIQLTASDIAEKLTEAAKKQKKLLIIAHRNPDGDAVGSAFALKLIYESLGAEALCACSDEAPEYLRFLLKSQDSVKFKESTKYDIAVTVDTASPSQMGELSFLADSIAFAIDHHASCTPYCDTYRDGNASAAGELIYKIYEMLKENGEIKKDTEIERLIYAAISADTGSFKYSNTTEETHKIAAKLVKRINENDEGINTAEISRLLHNCKSLKALKAEKLCIESLRFGNEGKIAYVVLKKEKIDENGLSEEDFGAAVDIPRCVEGVMISFVVKESKEKEYRISTRSSCSVSVADICAKFGGGGHAKAAGATIEAENAEIAADIILKECEKALKGES